MSDKIKIKRIETTRSETRALDNKVFHSIDDANAAASRGTYLRDGYFKTELLVVWEDGSEFHTTRYDAKAGYNISNAMLARIRHFSRDFDPRLHMSRQSYDENRAFWMNIKENYEI